MKHLLLILAFLTIFTGCKTTTAPTPTPTPTPDSEVVTPLPTEPEQPPQIALYWENTTAPHPERATWSKVLIAGFLVDLGLYSGADDVAEICPKYKSLETIDKLKALGEFMVALSYYESGFKPETESVDVGTSKDKGSWSVGLFQMSANDSSAKEVDVTYQELKDPHLNILVAMIQMKKQITKRNKFFLDKSDSMRYWAPLLINGKYNKIPEIKARVLKYAPKCA